MRTFADGSGNFYVVGITSLPNFATTAGALDVISNTVYSNIVFAQKLNAAGSVVASAAIAQASLSDFDAKIDAQGNLYLALNAQQVAGISSSSLSGIVKVNSQLNQIVYATHVFGSGRIALDVDTDGSVVTALVSNNSSNIQVAKLAPDGSVSGSPYQLTESAPSGYDGRWIGVAIGADHSAFVGASPMFLYRLNSTVSQTLYRASVGGGKFTATALTVDRWGNAYVAGSANDPLPTLPATVTLLDYTQTNARAHGLILRFDPNGANFSAAAFGTVVPAALALDSNGNLWGAGATRYAIQLFQLNAQENGFVHFLSVPSDTSYVSGLSLDSAGRPIISATTTSLQLPDTGPRHNTTFASEGTSANAGFLRLASTGSPADLQVNLTASSSQVPPFGNLIYQATLTNTGPSPATNVQLVFPEFINGEPDFSTLASNCQASGSGTCVKDGSIWSISYPAINPGETETVQFAVTVPSPELSPFPLTMSALTSSDDPNQVNNNPYLGIPVQDLYIPITTNAFTVTVETDGTAPSWSIGTGSSFGSSSANPGVPAIPGPLTLYIETPQVVGASLYAFVSWDDNVTDNPRTINVPASSPLPMKLKMREVTEPWIVPDSPVVNSASYRTGAVAPGEIITLFGFNLGPSKGLTAALDSSGKIATSLGGVSVTFDGAPAPIAYASATQTSVVVPYSVAGKTSTQMVMNNGANSAAYTIPVTDAAPGLFAANSAGNGPLAAFLANFSLVTVANPVKRGDVVVLYATGEGLTTPLPADGTIAGNNPPAPNLPVSVTIGGQPANVMYAGGVPGSTAGLMQINVVVPAGTAPGLEPVLVTIGTRVSQREATIAVQ